MRSPSVYANRSCPAGCACDVLGALHGPHRVGARLVMILLSHHRWPPTAIADLLGCDPPRCAAGSTATTPMASPAWPTGPELAVPASAAPGSASGS